MLIIILTILGFFIGSFICVVVDRFCAGQSAIYGRSKCENCRVVLCATDLIPIISYFVLRGKCRYCHYHLSWRYPLVELSTAVLFLLTIYRLNFPILFPVGFTFSNFYIFLFRDLLFVCLLFILFLIDAKDGVLPDRFTLPGIIIIFGLNFWLGIPWTTSIIGLFAIGGFFAFQYLVSRGTWVGGGDIRLGALLGVMFGLMQGVLVLLIAYVVGAIFAIVLLYKKRVGLKSTLSFGPFLAGAGWIVLFFGPYLSNWIFFR